MTDIAKSVEEVLRSETGKEFESFVKKIVSMVRQVPEYKMWIAKAKSFKDLCEVCGSKFKEVGLKSEFHHTPETLFEIVVDTIKQYNKSKQPYMTVDIVREVVEKHLSEEVQGVVVDPCCHKLLHYERETTGEELSLPKKNI